MTPTKRAVFAAITVGCASSVLSLSADTRPNPYLSIVTRNPFGIKPPPVAPPQEMVTSTAPMAKVVLTGVTDMFGAPRALLEITESEPGRGPQVNKRMLKEGERDGSVEILSIDVANSTVRIKNGAVETNVIFEVAKAGPTGPGQPGGPPTQFVPPVPHPAGAGAMNSALIPGAPGAPNPGASPYIISHDGANMGRSGSGVTLMGATPATTTPGLPPQPGVGNPLTPGSFPPLSQPSVSTPTPGVTTYGAQPTTTTEQKPVPFRNMRTDLIDSTRPRTLPNYAAPPPLPAPATK